MTGPAPGDSPQATRAVRMLYTALTAGAVLGAGVVSSIRFILPAPPVTLPAIVGYAITVASIVVLVVATTVLRPRIPRRLRQQSTDAFWIDIAARGNALAIWALLEGSAVLGAVGFFLTGVSVCLVGVGAAFIALAWARPGQLERID